LFWKSAAAVVCDRLAAFLPAPARGLDFARPLGGLPLGLDGANLVRLAERRDPEMHPTPRALTLAAGVLFLDLDLLPAVAAGQDKGHRTISTGALSSRVAVISFPPPRRGEGRGGGPKRSRSRRQFLLPPRPSPQGEGKRQQGITCPSSNPSSRR